MHLEIDANYEHDGPQATLILPCLKGLMLGSNYAPSCYINVLIATCVHICAMLGNHCHNFVLQTVVAKIHTYSQVITSKTFQFGKRGDKLRAYCHKCRLLHSCDGSS